MTAGEAFDGEPGSSRDTDADGEAAGGRDPGPVPDDAETGDPAGAVPSSAGRAVLVAVGLTLAGVLVGAVFGLVPVLAVALSTGEPSASVPTIAVSLSATMVGYATVGLGYARRYALPIPARLPDLREIGWVLGGAVAALLLVSALAGLVSALGLDAAENAVGEVGADAPVFFLVAAALSVLLVGPAEEILFRGAVQGRLRRSFGPVAAIGGASLLFAGVHVVAVVGTLGATLVTVSILFVPSLVLGAAYERTRNVAVPALIHGLYNATLLTGAYVVAVGGV